MHPKVFTPLQKDCYDFYIIIQKTFSQILRHIIRLFINKIGFCSKSSWVQKSIARVLKYLQPHARITFCNPDKKGLGVFLQSIYCHDFSPLSIGKVEFEMDLAKSL